MRKLKRVVVDWFYSTENGEEYTVFDVSSDTIDTILHYDKFVRVHYANNRIVDYYNINSVEYLLPDKI